MILFDAELMEARLACAYAARIEQYITSIDLSLANERVQETVLSQRVNTLPGLPFCAIVSAILSGRPGWVDSTKQEALSSAFKLENCRRRITSLELERTSLTRKRAGMSGAAGRCNELLKRQQDMALAGTNPFPPSAESLSQAGETLAYARSRERDLRDALWTGEQTLAALERAQSALHGARLTGMWEVFGPLTPAAMPARSRLDAAYQSVLDVTPLLLRFEREQAEPSDTPQLLAPGSSLAGFADIVADALLVNLLAQCELVDAVDAASALGQRVSHLVGRLSKQIDAAVQAGTFAQAEYHALLSRAG